MVRDMPRLTKASPPADRTRSTTPSISVSPASAVLTTTLSHPSRHTENTPPPRPLSPFPPPPPHPPPPTAPPPKKKKPPGRVGPGVPVRSLLSVQHLAGD